ncbi:putative uncharacterized protein DDB_G0271606 [Galendromus occidentalis]|uniref:Nuclear receptor coactivator 6 TRADD-N domain-containing protein n=1 Tax=Galendromus occidentalis TaxID=34638 RepID=A0AAJ7L5S0_9ACAR|nr:putative uncharacterized protein DDB_G0271606 [Galendromus occidentalis]
MANFLSGPLIVVLGEARNNALVSGFLGMGLGFRTEGSSGSLAVSGGGETVRVICEGSLSEPTFEISKVEPWNSVRVTLSVPREAAAKLSRLAASRDPQLRELGILSVQVASERIFTLSNNNNNNNSSNNNSASNTAGSPTNNIVPNASNNGLYNASGTNSSACSSSGQSTNNSSGNTTLTSSASSLKPITNSSATTGNATSSISNNNNSCNNVNNGSNFGNSKVAATMSGATPTTFVAPYAPPTSTQGSPMSNGPLNSCESLGSFPTSTVPSSTTNTNSSSQDVFLKPHPVSGGPGGGSSGGFRSPNVVAPPNSVIPPYQSPGAKPNHASVHGSSSTTGGKSTKAGGKGRAGGNGSTTPAMTQDEYESMQAKIAESIESVIQTQRRLFEEDQKREREMKDCLKVEAATPPLDGTMPEVSEEDLDTLQELLLSQGDLDISDATLSAFETSPLTDQPENVRKQRMQHQLHLQQQQQNQQMGAVNQRKMQGTGGMMPSIIDNRNSSLVHMLDRKGPEVRLMHQQQPQQQQQQQGVHGMQQSQQHLQNHLQQNNIYQQQPQMQQPMQQMYRIQHQQQQPQQFGNVPAGGMMQQQAQQQPQQQQTQFQVRGAQRMMGPMQTQLMNPQQRIQIMQQQQVNMQLQQQNPQQQQQQQGMMQQMQGQPPMQQRLAMQQQQLGQPQQQPQPQQMGQPQQMVQQQQMGQQMGNQQNMQQQMQLQRLLQLQQQQPQSMQNQPQMQQGHQQFIGQQQVMQQQQQPLQQQQVQQQMQQQGMMPQQATQQGLNMQQQPHLQPVQQNQQMVYRHQIQLQQQQLQQQPMQQHQIIMQQQQPLQQQQHVNITNGPYQHHIHHQQQQQQQQQPQQQPGVQQMSRAVSMQSPVGSGGILINQMANPAGGTMMHQGQQVQVQQQVPPQQQQQQQMMRQHHVLHAGPPSNHSPAAGSPQVRSTSASPSPATTPDSRASPQSYNCIGAGPLMGIGGSSPLHHQNNGRSSAGPTPPSAQHSPSTDSQDRMTPQGMMGTIQQPNCIVGVVGGGGMVDGLIGSENADAKTIQVVALPKSATKNNQINLISTVTLQVKTVDSVEGTHALESGFKRRMDDMPGHPQAAAKVVKH